VAALRHASVSLEGFEELDRRLDLFDGRLGGSEQLLRLTTVVGCERACGAAELDHDAVRIVCVDRRARTVIDLHDVVALAAPHLPPRPPRPPPRRSRRPPMRQLAP